VAVRHYDNIVTADVTDDDDDDDVDAAAPQQRRRTNIALCHQMR